ncbi:MAG: hypothetical protein JWM05_2409 [Acidimicrobiales bacterium]|nr:hypothetical protein [Acidimicrobiales bacterium]
MPPRSRRVGTGGHDLLDSMPHRSNSGTRDEDTRRPRFSDPVATMDDDAAAGAGEPSDDGGAVLAEGSTESPPTAPDPASGSGRAREPGPTLAAWGLGTAVFIVLAGLLPVVFTGIDLDAVRRPPVALALVITWYSSLRLAQLITLGRDAPVRLTFWVYVYLWLGLATTAQVIADRFPLPYQTFDSSTQVTTLACILLGLLAYDLGVTIGGRSAGASTIGRHLNDLEIAPRRVWGLAVLGTLSTAYFTAKTGLSTRFSSRITASSAFYSVPGTIRLDLIQNKASALIRISLLWMPVFVALYLLLYLYRSSQQGGQVDPPDRRWVTSLRARRLLGLLIMVNVLSGNPLSNPRYRFGGIMIALAIAFFPQRSVTRFRVGAIAIIAVLVIVFPYAAIFRYDQRATPKGPLSGQLIGSADYGMFQQQLNGFVYVSDHGHTMGRQVMGAVLSPVPRMIWKNKPIATGDLVSRTSAINASSDLWTEANVDFGLAGVTVFFLFYGWATRVFDDAYHKRSLRKPSVVGAAVPLFAAFQIFLVRGALQPAFGELAPIAVVFVCCLRRPRPAATPAAAPVHPAS